MTRSTIVTKSALEMRQRRFCGLGENGSGVRVLFCSDPSGRSVAYLPPNIL
jgi:hypothetical protein